jgi:hypothetical protein
MTPFAHVSGVPVEELMPLLSLGAGALWLAARTWLLGPLEEEVGSGRPEP